MSLNCLLAILADGQSHHVTELAQAVSCSPQQLNAIWQNAPQTVRPLLRQNDGFWRLAKPLAVLPEEYRHEWFDVTVLPETTSTNDVLLEAAHAEQPIHQRVVLANQQTKGRGRQGRSWHNAFGECLMFSVGWTFVQPQAELGVLALLSALACQQALASLGCNAQIKWPNDLVIGTDKLGGILIETVRRAGKTHAVIGIGINFAHLESYPHAIAFQAACTQKTTVRTLLDTILQQLHQMLVQFSRTGFLPFQAAYEAVHRDQNQMVYLLQQQQIINRGRVLGVSATGALRLHTPDGEQQISSGEVSLRRPEQLVPVSERMLLLDGGNSRLKWAWVEHDHILRTGQAPYRDLSRLQEEWLAHGHLNTRVVGAAVCGEIKKEMVNCQLQHPIEWLGSMKNALGVINGYRNYHEHGADRWFNVLGSRRFTQQPCVIVSCGTAVTVDALTADNHYLGGTIMPGFYLMHESLVQRTANLRRSEGHYYDFPTTTANAIATGMMDAVCGAIVLMHGRLQKRHDGQPVDLILTGGGANKIAEALPQTFVAKNAIHIVDNLVIFGLLRWTTQH